MSTEIYDKQFLARDAFVRTNCCMMFVCLSVWDGRAL